MLVLPFKVPRRHDLVKPLTTWIEQQSSDVNNLTLMECREDLVRLASLRNAISDSIRNPHGHASAVSASSVLDEYHAALLQFERHGVKGASDELHLEWTCAFDPDDVYTNSCLLYERACILWNIAALESYFASSSQQGNTTSAVDAPTTKKTIGQAIKHCKNAALILHYLRTVLVEQQQSKTTTNAAASFQFEHNLVGTDLTKPMLFFWEQYYMAQAQIWAFDFTNFGKEKRPPHLLLAKIAMGAVPLLNECLVTSQDKLLQSYLSEKSKQWGAHVKAWSIWLRGKAEYHESCNERDKSQWGMELARLDRAIVVLSEAQVFLQSTNKETTRRVPSLDGLNTQVEQLLVHVKERKVEAEKDNAEVYFANVPSSDEVREIRGKLLDLVKMEKTNDNGQPEDLLPDTMTTPQVPLFTHVMSPAAKLAVRHYHDDTGKLVQQMQTLVEEQTELARKALAQMNLPHSLTAYRQEQAGGGIPMELWERVETIQQEGRIGRLKQGMWELRDVADAARNTYTRIEKQLDEDLEFDKLFRQQHPSFHGHDAAQVQLEVRKTLQNYEKLLAKSQTGDAVLLNRLDRLETDPKYQLLQFQRAQLDRLLPGSSGGSGPPIDTSRLSRLLVELSTLLHEREVIFDTLKEQVADYDVISKVADVDSAAPNSEEQYQHVVEAAGNSFQGIAYDIQVNVDKQSELLDTILGENERFTQARDAASGTSGGSTSSGSGSAAAVSDCISMIEDAIDDVEFFTKHLKEGQDFYNVVSPKLEQLVQQVGDISVRLTVERCDYEDKARDGLERRRQEIDDARIAASLAGSSGRGGSDASRGGPSSNPVDDSTATTDSGGGAEPPHDADDNIRPAGPDVLPNPSHPGVSAVSHTEPDVRVDDEKVASLVAMDFDPDKVVAALKRYDNNIEQAVNDLLSC